jgi:hypothetical protein
MRSRRFLSSVALVALVGAGFAQIACAAGPVASTDGESPGTRLEIQSLKRAGGGTVMLTFTVINDGDGRISDRTFESSQAQSVDAVYLVDLAGKKKYLTVKDSDKNCVCSRDIKVVEAHTKVVFWAKFAAPPDGVDKIGVVVPHFIPMDDVPLAK